MRAWFSFSIFFLAACVGGSGTPGGTGGNGEGGGSGSSGDGVGQIYVSNNNSFSGNAILRFSNASTVDGDVAPAAKIFGALTTLDQPGFIFLDISTDRLYVANNGANSILVFDSVSTLDGDVAPNRTITSASLSAPKDVELDSTRDRLYVSNAGSNNLVVFANASTATGEVTPVATVTVSTSLNDPTGLMYDSTSDVLYVADTGNNAIKTFNSVSTWSGSVSKVPNRTVFGSSTQLDAPVDVMFERSRQLLVVNRGGSVLIYVNGSTIDGNAVPLRSISGSNTEFSSPHQGLYDTSLNVFYVANAMGGSLTVFNTFNVATGNAIPAREIAGDLTTLTVPTNNLGTAVGLAVDKTR